MNNKYAFYYLPLLCQILTIYNLVLQRYGAPKLYLIVYVLAIIALLGVRGQKCRNQSATMCTIYIVVSGIIGLFHLLFTDNSAEVIHGLMIYLLPPLYWVLYFTRGGNRVYDILYELRYHMLIVAIASIVQFFISPSLFGIYDDSNYLVELANNNADNIMSVFRSSSFLTSPQCLGLVMGLYTVVYYLCYNKGGRQDIGLLTAYFIGGALSGSKSFFLMIIITIAFIVLKSNSTKTKISIVVVIVLVCVGIGFLYEYIGFIDRLLNMEKLADDEKSGRLAIYSYFLERSSIFGNGPGLLQNISGKQYKFDNAAESYLIQIIYEMGYVVFSFFAFFLAIVFTRKNSFKLMIFLITLSLGYVHAFNGFIFFIFWAFFFVKKPQLKVVSGINK